MKGITALGGIFTFFLLMGSIAMGDDGSENAVSNGDDPWSALDTTLITSEVDVKDISGNYADISQGVEIRIVENITELQPYQEESIWTIEQYGSLLVISSDFSASYQVVGSTLMDEVHIIYTGPCICDGINVTVEGILDGEILESGQIVLNGVGSAYDAGMNRVFDFAETTILTPIDE